MKIGIVIIHCEKNKSSKYVIDIGDYFVKKGHELHVFTGKHDILNKKIVIHKIPIFSKNFYIQEVSFNLFSSLITKFHTFDVTMAQPTRYFYPDVAYMQFVYKAWLEYLKKNKIPCGIGSKLTSLIEKCNLKFAKKIISMSQNLKNQVIEFYKIPEEKIEVVYSGVNLKTFNPNNRKFFRKEIREKLGLAENEILLIFVGNPYSRKGLLHLVEALPMIEEKAKLIVLGRDLGEDKISNYQILAEKLKVKDRLIYGGFTSEVERYFSAADIFVLPTLYEPFGLVILEAMASGLPVVVSKGAGAAELIEDGKDGLLLNNPKNPKEIAEKINYLITNERLRKIMGRGARKKAEQYPWERTAKKMLEVFEEVSKR